MRRWTKALLIALAVVAGLVAWNAVAMQRETRPARATVAGAQILRLPGGDLQAVDEGRRDAPVLVLLHCHACSLRWWDRMAPRLARRHRVVRLDLLGYGGSEKPASGYSIPDQGRLVARALRALRARSAVVVGHSAAGAVAAAVAEHDRRLVAGIVTIDTPPDGSRYGDVSTVARLAGTPVVGPLLRRLAGDGAVRATYDRAFGHDGYDFARRAFPHQDRLLDDYRAMTYTSFSRLRPAYRSYTARAPVDARLRRLRVPALAIFGERDAEFDARRSLATYRRSGIATALVPGAGHAPNVEAPARVARLVEAFAERARRRPNPHFGPI